MTEPTATKKSAVAELEEESLAEFIGKVGPGAEGVKLYRRAIDGKYEYLTTLPLDGFSEEGVQDMMGGGRYQARLVDGGGKFVAGGSRVFRIAGRAKVWPEEEPPAGPAEPSINFELLKLMTERQGGGNAVELAVAMTTAMMTAITPLIAALAERPRGGEGGSPMGDYLDLFLKAHELGRDSSPSEGGYERVVRDLGVPVLNLLGQSVQQDRARVLNPGEGVPNMGAQVTAVTPTAAGPELPPWVHAMRPWVPMLVKVANEGKDPELYAELVLDHAGAYLVPLLDAQGAAGTTEALLTYLPDLRAVEPWIRQLVDASDALTTEGEGAAPEGGGDQYGPEDEPLEGDVGAPPEDDVEAPPEE